MAERSVGTNTRKKLINNEPFAYAHLVKFERPSSTPKGAKYSTDAARYAYFTDATHNLDFDDLSKNTAGGNNGSQSYIAGKLVNVGSYSETVEARASGMTLELAAESLNNSVTSIAISMTSTTITVGGGVDLVKEGFREGDKIFISGGANSGKYVNITGIRTNNTVLAISKSLDQGTGISTSLATQSAGTSITLSIVSDEIQGPSGEVNLDIVKSYANRDVWVYKAFLDPETGLILDTTPVLIFKGIITKASIVENPGQSVRAKWTLTSHWGDFAAVRGRPTNDAVHRALDANNRGQASVALRPEYAQDLGFLHAEETLNILATYTTIEQETKYKMKKKWYGKVKMKEVITDVEVENDVDLSFSLSSKFLPVVYGVQRISGIPFFVDTKENDPNNVFLAYALCEGEIGGIYDLYMDGNPLMCTTLEDFEDRNATDGDLKNEISIHCFGRADLGQTLGGVTLSGQGVTGSTQQTAARGNSTQGHGASGNHPDSSNVYGAEPVYYTVASTSSTSNTITKSDGLGITHQQTRSFVAPNPMSLTFYTGKIDQLADNTLVSIAQTAKGSGQFKRQADYYTSEEDYWGPNHKVLDTAYVVADIEIGEDATTVPEIEYVVRGKLCSSFNYDYSYAHSPSGSGESHSNFNVGDKVVLHRKDTDAIIDSSVLIIDKWSFIDPDANVQYRFRYSSAPSLGYSDGFATIKEFYMKNSSNQTWTMATWDYTDTSHNTGTVPSENSTTATVTNNGTSASTLTISGVIDWVSNTYGLPNLAANMHALKFKDPDLYFNLIDYYYTLSGTTLTQAGGGASSVGMPATGETVSIISGNTIKFASGASSTDDAYNDFDIELLRTITAEDGTSQVQRQTRTITDYDGGTKIATVNTTWDAGLEPTTGDTYNLLSKIKNGRTDDMRVSINPAIQLLDYLTGRYGKALDLYTDISLADFLLAARTCDDRGTQTLQGTDVGSSNVGQRYVLTSDGTTSGDVVAMGLVKSRGTSNSVGFTEFQQVFGKFTKKFMKNSYAYLVGDIIYTSEGYYRVTTAGAKSTAPTGTNPTGFTGPLTSVPLYSINSSTGAVSGSAVTFTRIADSIYYNPCAIYNSTSNSYETGYSLYDSDNVKYWRYYGWDDKHQRYATRHQTQGTVSTADSVFENVNGFLGNFNGLLSYEGGRYALRIETQTDTITSTVITSSNTGSYSGYTKGVQYNPRVIDDDDIIGSITLDDKGTAKSYNTISTSIQDPANQFKGRAVTFYDSNYLKSDKNVVKSGQINIHSVSNYYNARINVENHLRKSRFGLTISFKIGPKSLLLLAGDTIKITNSKFGFTEKIFRIQNINYSKDCTAQITAEEYDDSFYSISPPTLPSVLSQDQRAGIIGGPPAPTNLSASVVDNVLGGINLAWTNPSGLSAANCFVQIWHHTGTLTDAQIEDNATVLTELPFPANAHVDQIGKKDVGRYYWVRTGKVVTITSGGRNEQKVLYSAFEGPANATTQAPISAYGVSLSGEAFFTSTSGTLSPTSITLVTDRTNSTGNVTYSAINNSGASVTVSGDNSGVTITSANFGSATSVTITATLTTTSDDRLAGANNTYTSAHTIRKLTGGVQGDDAPRNLVSFVYHQASSTNQPNTPSATSYNISTNTFTGLTDGWLTTPPTFAAGNANKYWYSYFRAEENTPGGNTASGSNLTFIAAQQGIGFSGLVTFSSGKTISDGSTSVALLENSDFGASGTTTIDGARITTGTINAARITLSGKNISDLTNDSNFINASGAPVQSVNGGTGAVNITAAGLNITSGNVSGLSDAATTSVSTILGGNLTGSVAGTAASTVKSGAAAGATANQDSTADIQSGTTAANVGLGNVGNHSPANQLINGWSTTITAGQLELGNNSGARIRLDATSSAPRIEVYDS